jgi:hypothetical protein
MVIANCNFTLALLDGLEEQRNLSTIEKNFKRILSEHTRKLLDAKKSILEEQSQNQMSQTGR